MKKTKENKSVKKQFITDKKTKILFIIGIVFVLLSVSSFLLVSSNGIFAKDDKKEKSVQEMLDLFGKAYEITKAYYVEDISPQKLIEGAIEGMLSAQDPHSGYLNEEDFKEMNESTSGSFGGLGIEVTMDKGVVKVISPMDDTPAYKAGIEAGDYITHINGEQVQGQRLTDAVKKMKGEPGTKVSLTIYREGKEPFDVKLTRAIIKNKAVKSWIYKDSIGYLRISSFNSNASKELSSHIKDIKKKLGKDLSGYVLDLRNNPGGLLTQAAEVSDVFLDKGEIVSVIARTKNGTQTLYANKGDETDGKPVVVLINGGSASASEIVAGALQDQKRAVIAGTKSYGKGSVQTMVPLEKGKVALKITTARYYTPSGKSIQADGIVPDIEINQAEPVKEQEESRIFSESTLKNALKNDNDEKLDFFKKDENKKLKYPLSKEDQKRLDKDYQLQRSLELVKALSIYDKIEKARLSEENAAKENDKLKDKKEETAKDKALKLQEKEEQNKQQENSDDSETTEEDENVEEEAEETSEEETEEE